VLRAEIARTCRRRQVLQASPWFQQSASARSFLRDVDVVMIAPKGLDHTGVGVSNGQGGSSTGRIHQDARAKAAVWRCLSQGDRRHRGPAS